MKKTLSVIAIAILALSFSISANAVTKKGDGVTAAGVGMHQPKKAVYQKRLRTICGARSKMSGAC
ncbi:MAG TPA: hypothetical protein VFI51_02220 [Bradyrhizobium sp.]|nr:hypothetical protein [Bradyrhizobium sp.]